MPPTRSESTARPTLNAASLRPVLLLVAAALLVRIVYLVWFCRYDLVEDEAHYWLWSRYLDWSYYSKGPGVAWAIRASTEIFGNAEWAVRLPTAVASAIGALAAGALARDLAADARERAGRAGGIDAWASPARVGFLAALAYTLAPATQGAAILMTIDGPYIACWSVACWAFWRAVRSGGRPAYWLLVGAAIGTGFLFKYTILLLIPGLLVFAMLARKHVAASRSPERGGRTRAAVFIALAGLLVIAGLAPVLYWNAQNHWPTVRHLLGHLGMVGGDMPVAKSADGGSKWSPWWLPELIGQQIGFIGPWLFLACLNWVRPRAAAGSSPRSPDPRRLGRLFLLSMAAPILIFYAIVSLITEPEGNWPMAAYVTLLPLAAWLGADVLAARAAAKSRGEPVPGPVKLRVRLWRIGLSYAIIAAVFVHAMDRVGDAMLALDRQAWFHDRYHRMLGHDPQAASSRMRDPAGRLRGAREMAAHVTELLTALRDSTQREPFVIAQHYGRASQLAYYLHVGQRPGTEVLCAMAHTGGRESQFDYWKGTPHDLARPELLGRPAVIVTSIQPYMTDLWRTMFARVEPIPGERLRGESKLDRSALLGFEWKGVPGVPGSPGTPSSPPPARTGTTLAP
jgi:hypothetical protein